MKITILDTKELENVPSGSGLAKSKDIYYVIGDDSPYLFALNSAFEVISKTELLDNYNLSKGRIKKSEKPDFETLEMIDEDEMVIFGSGSKSPQRDIFIRVLLKDSLQIQQYEISNFYNELRNLPIFQDSELNIEATAYYNKNLFLFNRKKNLIISFKYQDFLNYINKISGIPEMKISSYSLPKINGIESGFSGATILKTSSKIIFTATVEDTNNAYDDGEILGSFVGLIDLTDNTFSNTFEYCEIPYEGTKLKVESVTVEEEITNKKAKLVFVTDDDKGSSIILKTLLEF